MTTAFDVNNAGSLLSEANDCGRSLLRLLSRGHAITAELLRAADALPATLVEEGGRFAPVLPDFAVFRKEGALEHVARTPEHIALDDESRELHSQAVSRCFYILAAIRKYANDLSTFLTELEAGSFISHSLEFVVRDVDGAQLLAEAIALLGSMLLLVEERFPCPARERALVAFHRFTVGTNDAADEFPDICHMFKATGRPRDGEMAKRALGYPEKYFARFDIPSAAIRMVIGQLQTGDVYHAASHYPLPEHRSHSLAPQAGLLYAILFFDVERLASDIVSMREIVNRHFADAWVVAYALGFTADLTSMWAPYGAAREALSTTTTSSSVRHLHEKYSVQLSTTRQKLAEYLTEGILTEQVVSQNTSAILNCLREANTTIRWLLLQPTTSDPKLQALTNCSEELKENVLQALVDTALLEERVQILLAPLVARREADWIELRTSASQKMDDLAVYFSGDHALRRNVRNEELERWFRGLQVRIDELEFDDSIDDAATSPDLLALGRKIKQVLVALEEVEQFHEISGELQIIHFLGDTRAILQKMVRTVNLRRNVMDTITRVADLSYAWKALEGYQRTMHTLLAKTPGSVKGLRALFLKLASILEVPLRRIRQAKHHVHAELINNYYSQNLVAFMRSVLQEIPRLIFKLLHQISEENAARPSAPFSSRISLEELNTYAERSEEARYNVGMLTQRIALLMRGIRETQVATLGALSVEPRVLLADGLKRELVRKIEDLLRGLVFVASGQKLAREDFAAPLQDLTDKSQSLKRAFEHVQDYVGVSALRMWDNEWTRITKFMFEMEIHKHLGRKLPLSSSQFHDAACPISFPDKSFLSRAVEALLTLTDHKVAVGGLRGDFRLISTGERLLDGETMETLYAALAPSGLVAMSRLIGFRITKNLRVLFKGLKRVLNSGEQDIAFLRDLNPQIGKSDPADAVRTLRGGARRSAGLLTMIVDTLATIGQYQLLRRRLHDALRLHCRLEAPLTSEALGVLNDAELNEAMDVVADAEGGDEPLQLPNILGIDGEGPSSEELLQKFQRRVAKACELSGQSDPLRQIYILVPEYDAPSNLGALLSLVLFSFSDSDTGSVASSGGGTGKSAAGGSRPSRRNSRSSRQDNVEEDLTGIRFDEVCAALVVGTATLLQQLPCMVTDSTLEVSGLCINGFCSEGVEGKEASWTIGAKWMESLGILVHLLGLPRGRLVGVVPQGMFELWPSLLNSE